MSFFQLYTGMIGAPVDHCVRTVMGKFPKKSDTPTLSITVSNNQRRRLNKHINDELHTIHGGLYIEPTHQYDGQGCWLFGGMHVVGGATDQGIYNGQLYIVVGFAFGVVKLQVDNPMSNLT